MNDLHEVPEEDARAITAAMVVLGALGFVAGIVVLMQTTSQGKPDWLSWILDNYMLTIGAVATGLFALGAYAFKTKRIYGYALLTLVIFVAGHFINFPLYYYLTALGTLIMANGIAMMTRFVRKYPKATQTTDA